QGLVGCGTLEGSITWWRLPMPSQTVAWQSPAGFGVAMAPSGRFSVPQSPATQVATTHVLGGGGQSALLVHPPPPLPLPPPPPVAGCVVAAPVPPSIGCTVMPQPAAATKRENASR